MNPLELPNLIASLNGQLDFMKSMIMDRYNSMLGQINVLIGEAEKLMLMYTSKGTEWIASNIVEVKLQLEPIMEQITDLMGQAEKWMREQMDSATNYITGQIMSATSAVDEQVKGVEKFVSDQTEKIVEQQAKLAIKQKENLL